MINIIIAAHGDFGQYLMSASEMIIGAQLEGVELVSINSETSMELFKTNLENAIEKNSSDDGVLILTDIFGGSPANTAFPISQKYENVVVLTGANLNMLIVAFTYRDRLEIKELTDKVLDSGKISICNIKDLLDKKGK